MAKLEAEMTVKITPEMSEEAKAFIRDLVREEVRKALQEQGWRSNAPRAYYPPRLETKELPAWARFEEGALH